MIIKKFLQNKMSSKITHNRYGLSIKMMTSMRKKSMM
jgi:hypothetical protein